MGLREISRTSDEQNALIRRFVIAQDSAPTQAQLDLQAELKQKVLQVATDLDVGVADSREKSVALTKLEEALMWAGKAIFS